MIHNDLSTQLQLLIKTAAPPLLEVSQQQLELPQLVPGQKVPAHVVASMPNGRFQVLVADKALDMNLPRNTQPGDELELVFVTARPRLTFILASDLANAATISNVKPQVSLNETARFLGGLLEKIMQPETSQAKTAQLSQAAPLLSGPPGKTLDFAQNLRGALTQCGLFYESHQAQWATGQRPVTDLLHEPQGRLSPAVAHLAEPAAGLAKDQPSVANTLSPALPNARSTDSQPVPAYAQNPGDALSGKSVTAAHPAHPDTLPIVRQQLEALDSRQVVWQGQVWQGQTMEWQIEERAAQEQGSEIVKPEWQTSLRLVLPQLGEIVAKLTLHPQGIRLQLDAADAASAALLAEQRAALRQGMEISGLQLVEMKVSHGRQEAAG